MSFCKFCFSPSQKFISDRNDFEFNTKIKLLYWKCTNLKCGFVYVDPLPSESEIKTYYQNYSTHHENYSKKFINPLSLFHKFLRRSEYKTLFVSSKSLQIKVLDFGCGNGNLLDFLKEYGLKNLYGYDFDIKALEFSANKGYNLFNSISQVKSNQPYDFIFLNHVIEHISDGQKKIAELLDLLNKDGCLIIRTPNSSSFLANIFNTYWRGWETPRHLNIYNYYNVNNITGNSKIVAKYTSNLSFSGAYHESFRNIFMSNSFILKLARHFFLPLFYLVASFVNLLYKSKGDELCVILKKAV